MQLLFGFFYIILYTLDIAFLSLNWEIKHFEKIKKNFSGLPAEWDTWGFRTSDQQVISVICLPNCKGRKGVSRWCEICRCFRSSFLVKQGLYHLSHSYGTTDKNISTFRREIKESCMVPDPCGQHQGVLHVKYERLKKDSIKDRNVKLVLIMSPEQSLFNLCWG